VKGTARPDSDLDIAVELIISETSERTQFWMDHHATWSSELKAVLPYCVHLELLEPEAEHVRKGVAEASCLCYGAPD
jgi:predicted nucleotidyltransferase